MKLKHLLLIAALPLAMVATAQEQSSTSAALKKYVIGFYNLENLFDTIDSPDTDDSQFLPDGGYHWTSFKYENKIKNMSYAISKFPKELAVLGVSEIENEEVIKDLCAQPVLADRNLKTICIEGPDRRGVDVGMIYNADVFTPTNIVSHHLRYENAKPFVSRDQLCVTGLLDGEEIHVIVLHWPSKYGGEKVSTPKRNDAALTTKWICDSIFAIDENAKIVVMGDLNDDPNTECIQKYLEAKHDRDKMQPKEIYNPCYNIYMSGTGTLGYQDVWCLYDQVMVSTAWLDKTDLSNLTYWKSEIFNKDFLKEQSGKRKGYPKRTHQAGTWTNGYSDHFPSLIWVVKK